MAEITHAEPSTRNGRKRTREVTILIPDTTEHVGEPTSQRRQIRSRDMYTGYNDLMSECIVIEPTSFEEAVQQPTWVDAMVDNYDSIIKNTAWEFFPRPEGMSIVVLRWIYKVKQVADGSVEKHKVIFVSRGFS